MNKPYLVLAYAPSGDAIEFVLARQDRAGRWKNEHAYERATWVPFERTRSPSKWVTLRACRVLRAALGDSSSER